MRLFANAVLAASLISSVGYAQDDEVSEVGNNEVVEESMAAEGQSDFGLSLSVFHDPLTKVNKLTFGDSEYEFGNEEVSGLTGLSLRFSVVSNKLIFSFGLDYTLETDIGGDGAAPSSWTSGLNASSQKFDMLGIQLIDIAYPIAKGDITILPSAGFGINIGNNKVKIDSEDYGSANEITYMKVLGVLNAGAKAEYEFVKNLVPFIGADLLLPFKLGDNLDQSGDWSFYSLDEELTSNLDFMSSLGARINLGVGYYF